MAEKVKFPITVQMEFSGDKTKSIPKVKAICNFEIEEYPSFPSGRIVKDIKLTEAEDKELRKFFKNVVLPQIGG